VRAKVQQAEEVLEATRCVSSHLVPACVLHTLQERTAAMTGASRARVFLYEATGRKLHRYYGQLDQLDETKSKVLREDKELPTATTEACVARNVLIQVQWATMDEWSEPSALYKRMRIRCGFQPQFLPSRS
jgi:hypothetical protein